MINFSSDLLAILEKSDFEDGDIIISSCKIVEDTISLIIELWDELDEISRQQWRIECKNVRDYKLQPSESVGIEIAEKHILLYPHNELQSELFFNGSTKNQKELLADIVKAHNGAVDDWFGVQEFIHQLPYQTKEFKYGLFAKGPDLILQKYADVLGSYDISSNIINQNYPKFWNNGAWQDSTRDNVVLFIGDNYIITNNINTERISS